MLTQAEVREMRALTTRVQKRSASREDWANLAALALVFQGDATTTAIAAEGLRRLSRARPRTTPLTASRRTIFIASINACVPRRPA